MIILSKKEVKKISAKKLGYKPLPYRFAIQKGDLNMAKYVYPAIFTPEENGKFSIHFPDIEGCFTCGENISDGLEMAKDALSLMLYDMEEEGSAIPTPTPLKAVQTEGTAFATYILADTFEYRKQFNNRAVKKTLSIPSWLNEIATAAGINFSQVLQDALKQRLNIV